MKETYEAEWQGDRYVVSGLVAGKWISNNGVDWHDNAGQPADPEALGVTIKLDKNPAAVALGKLGGSVSSAAKTAAAKKNGIKGGRPKKKAGD